MSTTEDVPSATTALEGSGPRSWGPTSLRKDSAARFFAEATGMGFGLVAAIISARFLGPSGKGTYASLSFLGSLFRVIALAGLGDAAVILVRNKTSPLQRSFSVTTTLVLLSSTLAAVAFFIWASLQFGRGVHDIGISIVLISVTLPLVTYQGVMISYLIALGRIVASSALLVFMGFITTASMFVFLALLDLGIPGAVLSVIVAAGLALVPSVVMLKRAGLKLRPAFEGAYARTSLRLGAVIQISQLLRVASGRLDLLLVFSLLGARDAGFYSTGLTVLGLVALIPGSLTYAAFPRLAEATDEDSAAMTERLGRFSTAAGLVSAVGMMILIPFLIPALFGEDFRPAIWPSLLLAPAGIMWGNQIWVARAVTARNKPRALLTSYGATLIVMVALDYLLIPHLELAGAIIGALISGAVGLFVAHREFHRAFPGRPVMASLVPRAEDFRTLLRIPGILLARLRR